MKMIIESPLELKGEIVEDLNEATGTSTKSYYISGVFSTIGEKNKNGRIYPFNIWETEVSSYQRHIQDNSVNTLMEWEHPDRSYVDPMAAIAKITSLKVENNKVIGRAKLLNNDKANQLKTLIDEGIKIGVSSRGVGSVNKQGIVEQFKLVTYDVVANPSDYGAYTSGLTESLIVENGVIMNHDYDVQEGKIVKVCSKDKCIMMHRDQIDEAVISTFSKLFEESKEKVDPKADLKTTNDFEKEPEEVKGSLTKLPPSFNDVTVSDLLVILKHIIGADSVARFKDVVDMIGKNYSGKLTVDIIRKILFDVRAKKYNVHEK
jgi:hypothetical protein